MDEMNITPFSSSRPQRLSEAVAWSKSTMRLLQRNNIFKEATSSSQSNALHMTLLHPPNPPTPPPPISIPKRRL